MISLLNDEKSILFERKPTISGYIMDITDGELDSPSEKIDKGTRNKLGLHEVPDEMNKPNKPNNISNISRQLQTISVNGRPSRSRRATFL